MFAPVANEIIRDRFPAPERFCIRKFRMRGGVEDLKIHNECSATSVAFGLNGFHYGWGNFLLRNRPFFWIRSPSTYNSPPLRKSQTMSQCRPLRFLLPVSLYPAPRARWIVPPIFSSNNVFFV